MKDLGVADLTIGIKISKTPEDLVLSQSHYIEEVLKRYEVFDRQCVRTPMYESLCLDEHLGDLVNQM